MASIETLQKNSADIQKLLEQLDTRISQLEKKALNNYVVPRKPLFVGGPEVSVMGLGKKCYSFESFLSVKTTK